MVFVLPLYFCSVMLRSSPSVLLPVQLLDQVKVQAQEETQPIRHEKREHELTQLLKVLSSKNSILLFHFTYLICMLLSIN